MFNFLNREKRHLKKEYEKMMPSTILYPSLFQLGKGYPLSKKEIQQEFLMSNSEFTDECARDLPFNTISISYCFKEKEIIIKSDKENLTVSEILSGLSNDTGEYFANGGDDGMTVFNGLELDCIEENETGFYPRYITLLDYPQKEKN